MEIPPLDEDAMTAAYDRIAEPGLLGKLDGLALWLVGVQGRCPPAIARRRAVVFGESTVTLAGAPVRVEPAAGYDAGAAVADAEIDAGADLLVACDGAASVVPAATVVCALTDAEPVEVVGRHFGDSAWTRDVSAIRDVLRTSRARTLDPRELLDRVAGPEVESLTGFLVRAAARRTAVLLDGPRVAAAALVAAKIAPGAQAYWAAGHRSPDPAHAAALRALGLEPVLDLGVRAGGGALLALPVLDAAVATLS